MEQRETPDRLAHDRSKPFVERRAWLGLRRDGWRRGERAVMGLRQPHRRNVSRTFGMFAKDDGRLPHHELQCLCLLAGRCPLGLVQQSLASPISSASADRLAPRQHAVAAALATAQALHEAGDRRLRLNAAAAKLALRQHSDVTAAQTLHPDVLLGVHRLRPSCRDRGGPSPMRGLDDIVGDNRPTPSNDVGPLS